MKKILFLLFVGLLAVQALSAQKFREAYYIDNKGQRVDGLIEYRSDEFNMAACRYKYIEKATPFNLSPEDIKSYHFVHDGKSYVSKRLALGGRTQTVFLEHLVTGAVDLFFYKQGAGEYYYFEYEPNKLMAIAFPSDRPKELLTMQTRRDLNTVFNNKPEMKEPIANAKSNKQSMIDLALLYDSKFPVNGVKGRKLENEYYQKWFDLEVSAYTGLQYSQYTLTRVFDYFLETYLDMSLFPAGASISPMLGVELDMSSPRIYKAVSMNVDLGIGQIKGESGYVLKDIDNGAYHHYQYEAMMANGRVGVKYTHQRGVVRPVFQAGFSTAFLFNAESTYMKEVNSSATMYIPDTNTFTSEKYQLQTPFYGFNVGVGCDYTLPNGKDVYLRLLGEWMFSTKGDDFIVDKKNTGERLMNLQLRLGYTF